LDVFGWFGVPSGYAMIAQRHMAEFGTTRDQLGAIVTACRNHGAVNPHAQLRKPLESIPGFIIMQFCQTQVIRLPLFAMQLHKLKKLFGEYQQLAA
jgi:acetyl-CoA acetyltransferase